MMSQKRIKIGIISVLSFLVFAMFVWRTSVFRLSKNFHEVDPGRFYRSAQLTPQELEEVVKQYQIKTVISLRGAPENSYWVPDQIATLNRLGIKFLKIWWTSDYFPKREELVGYLKALKEEQYPILVHCRTGADRTGEATAIYAMEFMQQSRQAAIDNHLNFRFWHVEKFHPAKKEFIRRFPGLEMALEKYDLCSPENRPWAEAGRCP